MNDLLQSKSIKVIVGKNVALIPKLINKYGLENRLEFIDYEKILSISTLRKVTKHNMVMINSHRTIAQIRKHYSQYKLLQADNDYGMYLWSFIARKQLDEQVKNKFSLMWV